MNEIQPVEKINGRVLEKFEHPDITAKGEKRASVPLDKLETLWINTGTLCNIECLNCYIESSPTNDRLVYFSLEDTVSLLNEIEQYQLGTSEIGFTGGEPFMNPEMSAMMEEALKRGFEVLVLTNAMRPMQRKSIKKELARLNTLYGGKLTIRVSLDHHTQDLHEKERGENTWKVTLEGVDWLAENNFHIDIAGRTCWGEDEDKAREGYRTLFAERGWHIDADNKERLVLFPEMEEVTDVPEITTDCWGILNLTTSDVMCSRSRMVVKRKGAQAPAVLPCTLLPYDEQFEMGGSLASSLKADGDMFDKGAVKLCHPYCAKFCVLGGGSCS